MEYARYVGRVGGLAVALGIGVAVANGGIANATTDADPSQNASQNDDPGGSGNTPPGTPNPDLAGTPAVGDKNNNDGATIQRHRPRVMILDALHGANVLGTHRAADQNPDLVKQQDVDKEVQQKQQPAAGTNDVVTPTKFAAPTGSNPVKQTLSGVRTFQRTLGAITMPPQHKLAPAGPVLPGAAKTAAVIDTLASQTHGQAEAGSSMLAVPLPPPPAPQLTPGRFVMNLLSAIGLRPEAFPPNSPLAPIGQVLEFVYAGLRRIDHQLFNQAPQASVLVEDPDPKTGVINGRVAYDPDDPLVITTVPGEGPQHGTVMFNDDGTFTYTPNYDETIAPGTTDSFTAQVSEATTNHLHPAGGDSTITVDVGNFAVAPNLAVVDTLGEDKIGKDPFTVAVTPDGTRAYVVVNGANQVRVIDTATDEVTGAIDVANEPLRIAINNAGTRAYVTMTVPPSPSSQSGISVIDIDPNSATYNQVVDTINVGTFSEEDVAVSPDDSRVYVTSFPEGTVTVIDAATNSIIATKSFPDDVNPAKTETNIGRMEFNPVASRNLAYITDVQDAEVLVVNTDPTDAAGYMTVVKRIPIPEAVNLTPQGIAVSADGNRAYVVSDDGTVAVIDTNPANAATYNTVIDTIPVGAPALPYEGIATKGNRVYVPVPPTHSVAVIDTDTNTVIASIPVGTDPFGVDVSPDGTRVYVPNFGAETGNGESNDSDDGLSVIAVLVPAEEI